MAKPRPRSMAFGPDGSTFLLMAEGSSTFLMRLVAGDRFEIVRRVAAGLWWFQISVESDGTWKAVFHGDSGNGEKRKVYDLGSERRAASTKVSVAPSHCLTSTLRGGQYAIASRMLYRYENGDWLNLDKAGEQDTQDEVTASFFVIGQEGVGSRKLSDGPDGWQQLYKYRGKRPFKQIVFEPEQGVLALAGRNPAALFVDQDGQAICHDRDGGLWSVCAFQGRLFFYSFSSGVIEISKKGEEVVHGVNGEIVRNQCLFANGDALYFVSAGQLQCYQQGRWRKIDVVAEGVRLLNEQAPKSEVLSPKRGGRLEAQLARILANLSDDSERAVYSDMLTEEGSAQGEFIALQLLKKKNVAQKRRISALVKAHGDEWLGPLQPLLVKRGRAFARGFLSKCEFKKISKEALQEALAAPELMTVSSLCLSHDTMSDLGLLSRLVELTDLELWMPGVRDLAPLAELTKLRSLNLGLSNVVDLSPLAGLVCIQKLSLRGAKLRSLKPLQLLIELEELDVSNTKEVKSLRPLANLKRLRRLELNRTSVSSVAAISKLTSLEVLDLGHTSVSDLSALSNLTELQYLKIGCAVDDTKPFAKLAKLEQLCHDGVPTATLREIKKLLPQLRIV